jgi:hypothetical protein
MILPQLRCERMHDAADAREGMHVLMTVDEIR